MGNSRIVNHSAAVLCSNSFIFGKKNDSAQNANDFRRLRGVKQGFIDEMTERRRGALFQGPFVREKSGGCKNAGSRVAACATVKLCFRYVLYWDINISWLAKHLASLLNGEMSANMSNKSSGLHLQFVC